MATLDPRSLARLGELLWGYRRALDRLEFALTVQLVLQDQQRADWNSHVSDLVDEIAERIGLLDVERTVLLGDGPTSLTELIDTAPEPWPALLTDHQAELRAVGTRIDELMRRHHIVLDESRDAIRRLTDSLTTFESPTGYDRRGQTTATQRASILFDGTV